MRIVGIVDPLPHGRSVTGENSFHGAPGGKCIQETCAGCPQQRYATGETGKVQGWGRVGIVERSHGNHAWGTKRWGHHLAKRNVKLQVRDLVRVVGIVAPFATRGNGIRGNSFYRALGGKWAPETCVVCL